MNYFEIFIDGTFSGDCVKAKDRKVAYKKARQRGYTGKGVTLKVVKKPKTRCKSNQGKI